jgi:hypothetical protein
MKNKPVYLICLSTLLFCCGNDNTVADAGSDSNGYVTESTPVLPHASPASMPAAGAGVLPSPQTPDMITPAGTGTSGHACLQTYSYAYGAWYALGLATGGTRTESCDRIVIKDANGKNILEIKFAHENCEINIKYKFNSVDIDTAIIICQ